MKKFLVNGTHTINLANFDEFTISFNGREPERRFLSGVFLVRTKHGLSRPCLVTAETEYVHPLKCHRPGEFALYEENPKPGADGWYEAAAGWITAGGYWNGIALPIDNGTDCPRAQVVMALYALRGAFDKAA